MYRFNCNKCNKGFNHKGDYDRHVNRLRPCNRDGNNSPHNLLKKQIHVDQNMGGIESVFECSQCNKTYSSLYSLNRHVSSSCNALNIPLIPSKSGCLEWNPFSQP